MNIQEKVINWVRAGKGDLDGKIEITDSTDLLINDLLDSLGLLQLVVYIEDEFDLRIPVEALTPDNFSTPASISALINRIIASSN